MPELPEVETVRRGLAGALENRRLLSVELRRADLRFPFPEAFAARLRARKVLRLDRRAKYLLFDLDGTELLACHLGMSGRFLLERAEGSAEALTPVYYASPPDPAHTHVIFEIEGGARLLYNDPRRFGYMTLIETAALDRHPFFARLGPEPLDSSFDGSVLARALVGRKQSVKACLLDQSIVAGVGNIYACEALHRAGLSPMRPAGSLTDRDCVRLVREIKAVLGEAILAGGSTLRDHAGPDGAPGAFQSGFRVYDREGALCMRPRCRGAVRRVAQNGRSTFYCDRCQR